MSDPHDEVVPAHDEAEQAPAPEAAPEPAPQDPLAEALVEKLLPVLDTFDLAVAHQQDFEHALGSLLNVLEKEGLERIQPDGEAFDPNEHDAVAHEAAPEGEGDVIPSVCEVMRPGYRWKGRVVRPAMVRVKG